MVLSACETAAGRGRRGDGVESLARGFLMAGAQYVLASRWRVDDEATSRLMGTFYKTLRRRPPAEALHEARRALVTGQLGFRYRDPHGGWRPGRWSHPYYWASFALIEGGQLADSP